MRTKREVEWFTFIKTGGLLIVAIGLAWSASAQNLAQHNWYFGNSANAIRFNRATNMAAVVAGKAVPFGTGGSAVATDPATADLWFYTDGNNVFDATNVLMATGAGLAANASANQPVAICQMPGDSTKFLIFTNTANYTAGGNILVSVVDMTQFGNSVFPSPPLGKVTYKNIPTAMANRSEGMMIIPHANGTDYWLISHQNNSVNYFACQISKTSFNPAGAGSFTFTNIVQSQTPLPATVALSVANFSYFKKKKLLTVSPQTASTNALTLLFNETTGALSLDQVLYNTGVASTTNQNIYDIQWDNKGRYLYVSRVGEAGINADVLQFDYLSSSAGSSVIASVLSAPIYRSWGLQLAPDSAIYHLYQATSGGPFLAEKFTKTDTIAARVTQTPLPLGALNFTGTQFPSFIPKINISLQLSFTSSGSCQNSNITFFPNVFPNADSLHWDFGDTTRVTDWSPVHKFKMAKTYTVTLTGYYQGNKKVFTKPITITPFSLKLILPSDTTACACQLPVNKLACTMPQFSVKLKTSGGNPVSYIWSNGQTGTTLKPDSSGFYYVVVTDASGCSAYAGVTVKQYKKTEQRSNIWYFGNKAGINFNLSPPKALSNSNMVAPAGSAIVCDQNGQTIFYTNGSTVWNKKNQVIATQIGGDSTSSQSALIIPVPNDQTLYYIFTTQPVNGFSGNELRYSLFDLKMNNGTGGLVQKNILLFAKSTERLTGNNDWLIAHEYGNNTFRAYRITAQGISDPVYSAIGSTHSFQNATNAEGYMKLGPNNNLAVALSTPGTSNLVEVFHLNDSTGMLTYYRKITLSNSAGQVYGVEFSPGGKKLFISVRGASSDIYEYWFDYKGHLNLLKDNVESGTEIGALQIAPDSQIYFAINNSTSLGTIQAVEDTTKVSGINLNGFNLAAGTNSYLGLPNFRQQVGIGFGGPAFTFTGLCLGDSTKFVGTPTDAIDKFQWFFGDGGSSTKGSPTHLYASAGTYNVQMRLTNRCGLDTTITQQVVIRPKPAKPSLAAVTALCASSVLLNSNLPNTPGLTYLWSTGVTTDTLRIFKPTKVTVTNTDTNGCSSTAMGIVVDNRPIINLGPDITICRNSFVPNLDAGNPGSAYTWTINGAAAGASQTQSVSTTTPGIFKYGVLVVDPITTCRATGQKTFTVMAIPAFTMAGTNPTSCGATNGTITLTSVFSPNLYSYFVSGGSFNQLGQNQSAAAQGPFTGLSAGTYSAIITDQITGCTASSAYGLVDATFTASASFNNCNPSLVKVTPTGGVAPYKYTFTNAGTGQVTGPLTTDTTSLVPGNYVIQVVDNSGAGCTYSFNQNVNPIAPVLTITPSLCANPATLTASVAGATSYNWTGPAISGSVTGSSINILAGGMYQVVVKTSGGCKLTQTSTVLYNGPITPAFTQSDPCQNQVILTATPTGSYTYRWYENGSATPTQLGQLVSLTASDNGASFVLQVVDAVSGCTVSTTAKTVQVTGPVTAGLTSSLACDDGKPFTLTSATNAASPTYVWKLNGNSIAGAAAATLQQTTAGTYEVDITLGTCQAAATILITRAPVPTGQLPVQATICSDIDNHNPNTTKVTLDPGFFTTYDWFKNTVSLSYTLRTYTADSPGTYSVNLTNTFGCSNTNTTNVINDCEPAVTAPNAFRPGSTHDVNTYFQVFSFFITDTFEVLIYNRWGELVYESKDRKFQWHGDFNGNGSPLPGGTYTYLVRYVSTFHPDQGVQELRGGVVLLR
ncbi:MAG: gliding motility-associated C-terminal domain-containing protein [Bacteroidetes bacterium]|nr:gliding motility-associated C-terminal domain-containing protein [Bacteroidota bacterium]